MLRLCLLIIILGTITVQGAGLRNSPIHFHAKRGECSVLWRPFVIKKLLFCNSLLTIKIDTKHRIMFRRIFIIVLCLTSSLQSRWFSVWEKCFENSDHERVTAIFERANEEETVFALLKWRPQRSLVIAVFLSIPQALRSTCFAC